MTNPWLHWWSDNIPLPERATFPRLIMALVLGSIIGAERQWRQRAAGMRTNALVCFGAAAFVDLGATLAGPTTTNIIAYVISGVGFLGAGAIMKEGGSIRGLNTAATLWCSAAVGACAGAGEMLDAAFVTALLITINLVLRPISRYIDKRSSYRIVTNALYRVRVLCSAAAEHEVRDTLLHSLAERPVTLKELRTEDSGDSNDVSVHAIIESAKPDSTAIEQLVDELRHSRGALHVEWAEITFENE